MSARESDNLRAFLASKDKDQYKKTGRFKENIKIGNIEVIPIVLETIESVLTNKKEEPLTRLNALRFLKECVDLDNQTFNFNVETGLLNTIYAFAVQLDRKTLLKPNPTLQEEKISMSFYILCLECIKVWAHWYPEHKGVSSSYMKMYLNLKTSGFKFPAKLNFFRDIDLYRFNAVARADYMHKNIKKQVEILKNLHEIEDNDAVLRVLKELDYFLRHSNEIIANNYDDIPEHISRDLHQYQPLIGSLHQILNDYKKGNIIYVFMKNQVYNIISNYESSTHQRASEPFLSRKSISPNSSGDFDLKCENIMLSSQSNLQTSQSFLDDRQINTILNKNNYYNTASLTQKINNINTNNSIDATDSEYHKNTSILDQKSSFAQKTLQPQQLFDRVAADPNKQMQQNRDFNFTEQNQIERLEERVAELEKAKETLEQKSSQLTVYVETLMAENKKLQILVDQKQDDIDLLKGKETYFSYSTDYQNLLCLHQKMEQDYNELTYKVSNFESEKQLIVQENEHFKQQQVSLLEMTTNQKDTIKELQLRIASLQKDIKFMEDEKEGFKKDCERKYSINHLLTAQKSGQQQQLNQRQDVSANYASVPAPNNVKFSEKDFMRGVTVPKSQNLLAFLNNDCDVEQYSYKLGCLHSSVNIYENDYIKVVVSKIDKSELDKQTVTAPDGAVITPHMGLTISVLNKSNINIKQFEINYCTNSSLRIVAEGKKSASVAQTLNSQNLYSERIFVEVNTIPFQIPEMTIKMQSNYIQQSISIPLPITINSMMEYQTINQSQISDMINKWNAASNDSIFKSAVFTVSKQLVDKKQALHQFFPAFTQIQSSSINFYELIGTLQIPLINYTPTALKITLINDRFICFQIKPFIQNSKSLYGVDSQAQPFLKNIHTNTLQYIIQTFQELLSDQ